MRLAAGPCGLRCGVVLTVDGAEKKPYTTGMRSSLHEPEVLPSLGLVGSTQL
jgi:hypothetical protein